MNSNSLSFNRDLFRQWLTFIAILTAFGVNVFSNIVPLNGLTIGEISNSLFAGVKIIPANYAFAIWGLIYLGLFSLGIYQLLPSQRDNYRLKNMGYFLVMACVAQTFWVWVFLSRLFLASLIAMIGILLALIAAYLELNIGKERVPERERWFVNAPISIYLAWITVATIVNVAICLESLNWNGWGIPPEVWTVLLLIVAGVVAVLMRINHQETAFPLVFLWAIIAIAIRQFNEPLIVLTALAVSLTISLVGLGSTVSSHSPTQQKESPVTSKQ
ncbi:tryptophan-rich sensory protein [Limnoraphis robusta]|uniref:Tryptophan-rich sensory protein n=1 Tax=Limnoraphis robusta CCNP1315 TaxID=3110306 RepID=A0ABU5TYY0_9CYAN|nr:tryptophan-rich sensory protein [Limnoraphis robusta]MEA5520149.1 tryptophan-rich sensory protein [Limnoraphis robusta CCNP1315]MEA5543882.1 tryptophan-rich sensory protein [Limnoraphis robusta CCNP1324]